MPRLYCALIKTHHMTSRRKISALTQAAAKYDVAVLIRTGGVPGIMFAKGTEEGVRQWVGIVRDLRYKNFQVVAKPEAFDVGHEGGSRWKRGGVREVESVKAFAREMEVESGVGAVEWWRRKMGFVSE